MNQLDQYAVRVAPQWWRHGYVKPVAYEFNDGVQLFGYELDWMLDEVPEEELDAVYDRLVAQEKGYLTKWPFLYELEKGEEYRGKLDTLPTEFIAHQIKDIDTENFDEIFDFVCTWGFPYSPLREDRMCAINYGELHKASVEAINETENMRMCTSVYKSVISVEEVIATLNLLKEVWLRIERAILGDEDACEDMAPINAASNSALVAYSYFSADDMATANAWSSTTNRLITKDTASSLSIRYRGMLTCAIANQLLETIKDSSEWKQCPSCSRVFKRKQGASLRPDNKSVYCCDRCREREKKRRYRSN